MEIQLNAIALHALGCRASRGWPPAGEGGGPIMPCRDPAARLSLPFLTAPPRPRLRGSILDEDQ